MTHTHDHHDSGHDHHESDQGDLEYRKSVAWGGFTAVVFVLIMLMIAVALINPFE